MYKSYKRKLNLLQETFPKFPTLSLILFIKNVLKGCDTVLDLGCGDSSPIRFINAKTLGVDVYEPLIEEAKRKDTHDTFKVLDVNKILFQFKPKSFEAVVAIDLIEHLSKKRGYELLRNMEVIASKKVLIFTPNGFIPQSGKTKYDKHISGWTSVEMQKQGYKVYGVFGPKFLRGEYHKIKYKPEFFWAFVSELAGWTYIIFHPESAAALLCVKDLHKT